MVHGLIIIIGLHYWHSVPQSTNCCLIRIPVVLLYLYRCHALVAPIVCVRHLALSPITATHCLHLQVVESRGWTHQFRIHSIAADDLKIVQVRCSMNGTRGHMGVCGVRGVFVGVGYGVRNMCVGGGVWMWVSGWVNATVKIELHV